MSQSIIKAAVIGVGNMGRHHARIYHELQTQGKGVALVGICDTDQSRAKEIAVLYGCPAYSQIDELFRHQSVDLVSVAVPTPFHKNVVLELVPYNPNILLEKPIAHNLKDAKEILHVSNRLHDRIFAVGHVERFNPAVEKLKEIIDQGKLGEISSLIARRVGVAPPKNKEVGVLVDLAIHEIDIFYYLLGKFPVRVSTHKRIYIGKKGEDCVSVFLDYGDYSGFIHANWITPIKIRLLQVTGTKGYAELNYLTQELVSYKRSPYTSDFLQRSSFKQIIGDRPHRWSYTIKIEEPLKREIFDIVNCIRSGEDPRLSLDEAYKVFEFLSTKV